MANEDPTGIDEIQLEVLYKQPIQNCYSFDQSTGTATYKETWKGNFTHITNTYKALQNWSPASVDDYQDYNDFILAAGGSSKLNYEYDPPTLPTGVVWKFNLAEVSECKAGDNAELTITWVSPNMGQFDPLDPEQIVWTETWNLSWQTKTASLYAYCGNIGDHVESDDTTMRTKAAQRTAIENWFNLANEYNVIKDKMWYQNAQNMVNKLNTPEKKIAQKIMQGETQVMYHYPILTYTKYTECKKNKVDQVLQSLQMLPCDTIQDVSGVPFTIPLPPGANAWEWLLVQSDIQTQRIKKDGQINVDSEDMYRITWTQVGWGAAKTGSASAGWTGGWDKNFYGSGNDRWLFGMA